MTTMNLFTALMVIAGVAAAIAGVTIAPAIGAGTGALLGIMLPAAGFVLRNP